MSDGTEFTFRVAHVQSAEGATSIGRSDKTFHAGGVTAIRPYTTVQSAPTDTTQTFRAALNTPDGLDRALSVAGVSFCIEADGTSYYVTNKRNAVAAAIHDPIDLTARRISEFNRNLHNFARLFEAVARANPAVAELFAAIKAEGDANAAAATQGVPVNAAPEIAAPALGESGAMASDLIVVAEAHNPAASALVVRGVVGSSVAVADAPFNDNQRTIGLSKQGWARVASVAAMILLGVYRPASPVVEPAANPAPSPAPATLVVAAVPSGNAWAALPRIEEPAPAIVTEEPVIIRPASAPAAAVVAPVAAAAATATAAVKSPKPAQVRPPVAPAASSKQHPPFGSAAKGVAKASGIKPIGKQQKAPTGGAGDHPRGRPPADARNGLNGYTLLGCYQKLALGVPPCG